MDNLFTLLAQTGTTPPQGQQPPGILQFVPILLLFVVFYLFLIRPQQKQRKEHQKMLTEIKSNDKVVTSGGIHGVVTNVKEKTLIVRIADGVKVEVDKATIGRVTEKGSGEAVSEKSK